MKRSKIMHNTYRTKLHFDTIVVGHSMGGLIALELAGISDKVKGVVLVNSSYKLPVHPKIIQTLAEGTFPENLFRASYAKAANSELLEKRERRAFYQSDGSYEKRFCCL